MTDYRVILAKAGRRYPRRGHRKDSCITTALLNPWNLILKRRVWMTNPDLKGFLGTGLVEDREGPGN